MTETTKTEEKVIVPNAQFWKFISAMHKRPITAENFPHPILALDPGETTGVAIWEPGYNRMRLFQMTTKDIGLAYTELKLLALQVRPFHIRCEDYRVYGHMTEQHAFAHLHTPQLIGAIKVLSSQHDIPMSVCLAMHAKTVWTDEKLKMFGVYIPGQKHARDAQRHLCRFMCEP